MTAYVPQPAPVRSGRPRGAKVLMMVGAALAVLGIIAIVIGAVVIGDSVSEIDERTDAVRDDLLLEVAVPGEDAVRLRPGLHYVYAIDAFAADGTSGTSSTDDGIDPDILTDGELTSDELGGLEVDRPDVEVDVTILDPAGTPVLTDLPGPRVLLDGLDDDRLDVVAEFRVTEEGTYTVAATSGEAPRVGIGRAGDISQEIGKALGGGVLVVIGVLGGTLGGVLLLAGFVWFLAGGSSSGPPPAAWTPPPGGWGPPPPGAPGGPPPSTPWGWAPPPGAVGPAEAPPPPDRGPGPVS